MLSNHIKALEQELGFELFDRSRDNELTDEGALLLDAAQSALLIIDSTLEECRQEVRGIAARTCTASLHLLSWDDTFASIVKGSPMSLSIGIVGLPNVGKSTLFTALTNKGGLAANYPFATIEPNVGVVPVPDARLDALAAIDHPARIVPATVEFVDIAGPRGGREPGRGAGQPVFGEHPRDGRHLRGGALLRRPRRGARGGASVDPQSDVETIKTELVLADMATVEKAHAAP